VLLPTSQAMRTCGFYLRGVMGGQAIYERYYPENASCKLLVSRYFWNFWVGLKGHHVDSSLSSGRKSYRLGWGGFL
jgi:hypothetical protein